VENLGEETPQQRQIKARLEPLAVAHGHYLPHPHFSNDRLNFKHLLWAAAGPENGIFAATQGISCESYA
jgi:hypothetical protein